VASGPGMAVGRFVVFDRAVDGGKIFPINPAKISLS
jgi:hypothetical protein